MHTTEQLENVLTLIEASDEAIEAAKTNEIITYLLSVRHIQLPILRAFGAIGKLEFFNYIELRWETSGGGFGAKTVYRLPDDFVRPTLEPGDLPEEMRKRLECREGILLGEAEPLMQLVIYALRKQNLLEFCEMKLRWVSPSTPTVRTFRSFVKGYSYFRYRLNPEEPVCEKCGQGMTCDCDQWRCVGPSDIGRNVMVSPDGERWYSRELKAYNSTSDHPFQVTVGSWWEHCRIRKDA